MLPGRSKRVFVAAGGNARGHDGSRHTHEVRACKQASAAHPLWSLQGRPHHRQPTESNIKRSLIILGALAVACAVPTVAAAYTAKQATASMKIAGKRVSAAAWGRHLVVEFLTILQRDDPVPALTTFLDPAFQGLYDPHPLPGSKPPGGGCGPAPSLFWPPSFAEVAV